MKRLRTVIFWCHLATGITIGSIVLIMAATGVLLTYQRQIQAWADTRGLSAIPAADASARLTHDRLIARVREARSGTITAVRWRSVADDLVEVDLARETTLFVDPRTGTVLGDGSERTRAFFRTITDVHRWLALPAGSVATGRAITGAANLAFLFMVCSGFYLWWPRNLSARAFRNVLVFRRGLRPKARDFNWHNVIGFWSFVPLIIIIASAVVTSYGWASIFIERIAPEAGERSNALPSLPGPSVIARDVTTTDLVADARARVPDWRSITMELPARSGGITFVIDRGTGGQPQRIARLTLAEETGAVMRWEPFSSDAPAGRIRSILRYAHTGEVAGVVGQTIAGLASAGAVLLVWTGISMALRRLLGWRRHRSENAA